MNKKENLFLVNYRYKKLIEEANALIPKRSTIINTLYKEVYEKDT